MNGQKPYHTWLLNLDSRMAPWLDPLGKGCMPRFWPPFIDAGGCPTAIRAPTSILRLAYGTSEPCKEPTKTHISPNDMVTAVPTTMHQHIYVKSLRPCPAARVLQHPTAVAVIDTLHGSPLAAPELEASAPKTRLEALSSSLQALNCCQNPNRCALRSGL